MLSSRKSSVSDPGSFESGSIILAQSKSGSGSRSRSKPVLKHAKFFFFNLGKSLLTPTYCKYLQVVLNPPAIHLSVLQYLIILYFQACSPTGDEDISSFGVFISLCHNMLPEIANLNSTLMSEIRFQSLFFLFPHFKNVVLLLQ